MASKGGWPKLTDEKLTFTNHWIRSEEDILEVICMAYRTVWVTYKADIRTLEALEMWCYKKMFKIGGQGDK